MPTSLAFSDKLPNKTLQRLLMHDETFLTEVDVQAAFPLICSFQYAANLTTSAFPMYVANGESTFVSFD